MPTFPCECEHKAHTERGTTPNGNPGHRYGQGFTFRSLVPVATPYGTLVTCEDCAKDCMAEFPRATESRRRCPDCGEYGCPTAPCGSI